MSKKSPKEILETVASIDRALPFAKLDFEALGVVESTQGPLLPTTLRVRQPNGSLSETNHCLMLLDKPRKLKAKKQARKWCEEEGFDPKEDPEILSDLESYEEFALIIRDASAPFVQSYPTGKELYAKFRSLGTLAEVKGEYDVWESLNDPRYGELNEDAVWGVLNAIVKEGTLRPLMRIGGLEQVSCILLSARAALNSPRGKSWLERQQTYKSGDSGSKVLESLTPNSSESSAPSSPSQTSEPEEA